MNFADKLEQISFAKATLIGMVLAGIYFSVFMDSGEAIEKNIMQLRNDLRKVESEKKDIQRAIEDAKKLELVEASLGGTLDRIIKFIPESLTPTEMMQLLSAAASETGANIINVSGKGGRGSRGKTDATRFLGEVNVAVRLEGSFSQFMLFLANLTQVEKIITIDSISITSGARAGKSTEGVNLSFSGSFTGYKFVPTKGNK